MAGATVAVRPAVLAKDRDAILSVLARNLTNAGTQRRFDWLYRSNPAGPSLVWVAEDCKTGEIVGTSAAHPKKLVMDGKVETVLNLSDFAFERAYRTIGPALKLLRASLAPIEEGHFVASYDHPSPSMAALYVRLGRAALGPWRRYARRLRVDDLAHKRFGDRRVVDVALLGVHLAVRLRDRLIDGRSQGVDLVSGLPPTGEIDRLDSEWQTSRFRLARSAAYVKWRFFENVTGKHEIIGAYGKGGRLRGYVVYRDVDRDTIKVLDLVAPGDDRVARALLGAVLGVAHARRTRGLAVTTLAGGQAERQLVSLGFWKREDGPGVVIWSKDARHGLYDPAEWWLVEGDEDV